MEKEPIYRVKVEVIGEEPEGFKIDESLRGGVDCSGFTLIADQGGGCMIALQHVTTVDLAASLASSAELMRAAKLALFMRDTKEAVENIASEIVRA